VVNEMKCKLFTLEIRIHNLKYMNCKFIS